MSPTLFLSFCCLLAWSAPATALAGTGLGAPARLASDAVACRSGDRRRRRRGHRTADRRRTSYRWRRDRHDHGRRTLRR